MTGGDGDGFAASLNTLAASSRVSSSRFCAPSTSEGAAEEEVAYPAVDDEDTVDEEDDTGEKDEDGTVEPEMKTTGDEVEDAGAVKLSKTPASDDSTW